MNRIIKVILGLIFVGIIFLTSTSQILAVTITINSFPSSIDSTDPFQISASVSGAVNATNYLRVDLYKEGTTNYFGETYNGSDWFSGSDGIIYFPIQIQNASASAILQAQIGNPSMTQYGGTGIYKLKLRRYTSSGSVASNDIQTPVEIQINYSLPSPSPEPTRSPTPVVSPTSTPSPTVRPTTQPTPKKSPTPSSTVSPLVTFSPSPNPTPPRVLGAVFTPEPQSNTFPKVAIGFVIAGILMIGISAYLAWMKTKI